MSGRINDMEIHPTNNQIISENTPELVMMGEKPTDSPFDCEGCGS